MSEQTTIGHLTEQLRAEYAVAMQVSAETGSPAALVEFFEANDASLQKNYGISLQELLNISPETLEKVKNFQMGGKKPVLPQPERPQYDWGTLYLIVGVLGGILGIGMLIKALR